MKTSMSPAVAGRHALALPRGDVPYRLRRRSRRAWRGTRSRTGNVRPCDSRTSQGCEVVPERARVQGGGHDGDHEVGPQRPLDLDRLRQRDVPVEVALVELVEDDGADAAQQRVEGHLPQEDPLGDEADPRPLAHARLEADLVAHQRRRAPCPSPARRAARACAPRAGAAGARRPGRRRGTRGGAGSAVSGSTCPIPSGAWTITRPLAAERGDEGGFELVDGKVSGRHRLAL